MARLLLAPIACFTLLAGALRLVTGAVAGVHGINASLADPALAPALQRVLQRAVLASCAAPLLAVPLGLVGAMVVAPAARWVRAVVYTLAVLLLICPAPGFEGVDLFDLTHPARLIAFGCAIARGVGLSLLILAPSLHAVPPGLRRAAIMAGATPAQAFWHAVVAPLAWPLAGSVCAAAIAAFVEGPAAAVLAPHMDLADAWVAPACLLLMASSIAALSLLLRRPAL